MEYFLRAILLSFAFLVFYFWFSGASMQQALGLPDRLIGVGSSENEFCTNGKFYSQNLLNRQDFDRLSLNALDFIGETLSIESHVYVSNMDHMAISGYIGGLGSCSLLLGEARVDRRAGLSFSISASEIGEINFRHVRQSFLENTDGTRSLAVFELEGELLRSIRDLNPFFKVSSVNVVR